MSHESSLVTSLALTLTCCTHFVSVERADETNHEMLQRRYAQREDLQRLLQDSVADAGYLGKSLAAIDSIVPAALAHGYRWAGLNAYSKSGAEISVYVVDTDQMISQGQDCAKYGEICMAIPDLAMNCAALHRGLIACDVRLVAQIEIHAAFRFYKVLMSAFGLMLMMGKSEREAWLAKMRDAEMSLTDIAVFLLDQYNGVGSDATSEVFRQDSDIARNWHKIQSLAFSPIYSDLRSMNSRETRLALTDENGASILKPLEGIDGLIWGRMTYGRLCWPQTHHLNLSQSQILVWTCVHCRIGALATSMHEEEVYTAAGYYAESVCSTAYPNLMERFVHVAGASEWSVPGLYVIEEMLFDLRTTCPTRSPLPKGTFCRYADWMTGNPPTRLHAFDIRRAVDSSRVASGECLPGLHIESPVAVPVLFTVSGATGAVHSVKVTGIYSGTELGDCIEAVAFGVKFPRFESARQTFAATFRM